MPVPTAPTGVDRSDPPDPSPQHNTGTCLRDWMRPPHIAKSFGRVRELVPTARVDRGDGPTFNLADGDAGGPGAGLGDLRLPGDRTGERRSLRALLDATFTDALVVVHRGRLRHEEYRNGASPRRNHLAMSVSKSITATAVGGVIDAGLLSPDDLVTAVLPELAGTGLDGATVRHVLDMRTGTNEEITTALQQRSYYAMIGWAPERENAGPDTGSRDHFRRWRAVRPHGGDFEYRSTLTCLLGLLAERVTGMPLAEVISQYLWRPLGAEQDADLTVDRRGDAVCDIGFCCTATDLARVGEMLRCGGQRPGGERVLSAAWVRDIVSPDHDQQAAFTAHGRHFLTGPQAYYRNQWWVHRPRGAAGGGIFLALGIHGQLLLIDEEHQLVVAKFSSWPQPWLDEQAQDTIDGLLALGPALAG